MNLRSNPASPNLARRAVAAALTGHSGLVIEQAVLMTSELVSNAVVHGAEPITLDIAVGTGLLTVSVDDAGTGGPLWMRPTEVDVHGRGVRIVDSLSYAWGVEPLTGGKRVWFSLLLDVPRSP